MLAFPLSFVEYFQPRILDDYSDPVDVKNKILDSKKAKEKLLAIQNWKTFSAKDLGLTCFGKS